MQTETDLIGQTFGSLTVLAKAEGSKRQYVCQCTCGKVKTIRTFSLTSGRTKSCGCQRSIHRLSRTRLYRIWERLKQKCLNPSSHQYKAFGGKGITLCPEWHSFDGFYKDMGVDYVDGMVLALIIPSKGFFKENCQWMSRKDECNGRSKYPHYTYKGKTQTIAVWAREYGMTKMSLWQRLHKLGWDIEKALTTPVKKDTIENKRRLGKFYTYNGKTQNLSAWSKEYGIRDVVLGRRLQRGWPIEKALTTPVNHPRNRVVSNIQQ